MPVVQPEPQWSPYPVGGRDLKPSNVRKSAVCEVCSDTHIMQHGDRDLMCTSCPIPCEECRSRGPGKAGGPFCETTPCACKCHRRDREARS